ncbi:MAG: DUF2478 domain-containing protein [Roseicyclus sp.]
MFGYVVADGPGAADRLLWDVAHAVRAEGLALAGAVQENGESDGAGRRYMDLHILSGQDVVRISQDLGKLSRGCRLDPVALEEAVGRAATALAAGPALLIANKFGKQELSGRGFRPVIAEALGMGVPVLTAVNSGNEDGFLSWTEDLAERLPPDRQAVLDWVRARTAPARARADPTGRRAALSRADARTPLVATVPDVTCARGGCGEAGARDRTASARGAGPGAPGPRRRFLCSRRQLR